MAHLWTNSDGGWVVRPLDAVNFLLDANDDSIVHRPAEGESLVGWIVLRCVGDLVDNGIWILLAPSDAGLWVNGQALRTGVRLLKDRDEIRLRRRGPVFFSTEELARVRAFPGALHTAHCGRCRQVIEIGSAAVKCPSCGTWHHQADDRPCWTYAASCSMCDQSTAFDAGFRWTPEHEVS